MISGADICKWLVQCKDKYAQDSSEAYVIAQELLSAGYLIPICCGYENEDDAVSTGVYLYVYVSI